MTARPPPTRPRPPPTVRAAQGRGRVRRRRGGRCWTLAAAAAASPSSFPPWDIRIYGSPCRGRTFAEHWPPRDMAAQGEGAERLEIGGGGSSASRLAAGKGAMGRAHPRLYTAAPWERENLNEGGESAGGATEWKVAKGTRVVSRCADVALPALPAVWADVTRPPLLVHALPRGRSATPPLRGGGCPLNAARPRPCTVGGRGWVEWEGVRDAVYCIVCPSRLIGEWPGRAGGVCIIDGTSPQPAHSQTPQFRPATGPAQSMCKRLPMRCLVRAGQGRPSRGSRGPSGRAGTLGASPPRQAPRVVQVTPITAT